MCVSGFPNLFLLYGPNTNQGGNSIIFILEAQFHYVLAALRHMRRHGIKKLEVRGQVTDDYNARLQRDLADSMWQGGCTSYFRAASGKITSQWPHHSFCYWALTRRLPPSRFAVA